MGHERSRFHCWDELRVVHRRYFMHKQRAQGAEYTPGHTRFRWLYNPESWLLSLQPVPSVFRDSLTEFNPSSFPCHRTRSARAQICLFLSLAVEIIFLGGHCEIGTLFCPSGRFRWIRGTEGPIGPKPTRTPSGAETEALVH